MAVFGIKNNKCFESVVALHGPWTFSVPDVGQTATQSFPLSQIPGADINSSVIVTASESYDPSALILYGYIDIPTNAAIIALKNVSDTTTEQLAVNVTII